MDTKKKWYEDFEIRHDFNPDHTQTVTISLPYAGHDGNGFSFSGTALTGTTKSLIELLESALLEISKRGREERTFTQKELYQFVTEYSREAREEGFDSSVGDFVDWVASREEKPIIEKQGECKECHCETVTELNGNVYRYLCPLHRITIVFSRGIYDEHPPACTLCDVTEGTHWDSVCATKYAVNSMKDKPVLPEKLDESTIHTHPSPLSSMATLPYSSDVTTAYEKINEIIVYLSRKEQ